MHNELLYMGTCGGAKVAGKHDPEKTLYDNTDSQDYSKVFFSFFGEPGCSISYLSGTKPEECYVIKELAIRTHCLTITSGTGLAIHFAAVHSPDTPDFASAKSFACTKNPGERNGWCLEVNGTHQEIAADIAANFASGPFFSPVYGTWWVETTGRWWIHHRCVCAVCSLRGYKSCHSYIARYGPIENV